MSKDLLGDRMKHYENTFRYYLPNRLPVILRVDGKAFSKLTAQSVKPFDSKITSLINDTAIYLCKNIQGAKLAYIQSDEISILIYNSDFKSEAWFGGNIQKINSVAASIASSYFSVNSEKAFDGIRIVQFDCRVCILPKDEISNYFYWRQSDASRNSIQSLARSLYSHKECTNKNCNQLKEMCSKKSVNWEDLSNDLKYGRCVIKKEIKSKIIHPISKKEIEINKSEWQIDNNIPIFYEDRNYTEQYLKDENI